MKAKAVSILAFLIIMTMLFSACGNEETDVDVETGTNMTEDFVQGFVADDSGQLADILTVTYSLEELRGFFGETSMNENLIYSTDENKPDLSINSVDSRFPIECLRRNGYSVYKVTEGGYFYVFWVRTFNPFPEIESDYTDDASVYFTAHITSLKKASDFKSIRLGISTAEDVARIDPAFELCFLMSSRTSSFSLLDNGSVMEIWYKWGGSIESRKDLIVKRIEVDSKKIGNPSCMSKVLIKDLP